MRGEKRKKRDLKTNTLGQIKIKILKYEKFSSQKANISSLFLSRFSFFSSLQTVNLRPTSWSKPTLSQLPNDINRFHVLWLEPR